MAVGAQALAVVTLPAEGLSDRGPPRAAALVALLLRSLAAHGPSLGEGLWAPLPKYLPQIFSNYE